MANKIKISKAELPFLKKDLIFDAKMIENLSAVQDKYTTHFKERIDHSEEEALLRYTKKIESLKAAKATMIAKFDAQINKYQKLVAETKKEEKPAKKPIVRRKAPVKKATTRKIK